MPNEGSFEAAKRKSDLIRADFEVNPGKYRMLTGDRPTGRLHLGHYFGTLKGRVDLQNRGIRTNIVIADYQVITDRDTTANIADNVYNIVIDYLACGIDPQKTMIFTHSSVPALNQLMLPFLSLVSESELERNPTVKAEQEASGHALTGLLLTYPVHQACDILFCKGNVVPVGKDQLPHIEITRTIARRFNERYAPVFPEPEGVLSDVIEVPGLDGRKMSKSYKNYIGLTDEPADMFGKVMSIADEIVPMYYRLCSTCSLEEVDAIDAAFADGTADPYRLKRELGVNIVDLYHGEGEGIKAMEAFDAQFKKGEAPEDMPEFPLSTVETNDEGMVYLAKLLADLGICKSAGEGRRLIDGGGVKIDGEPVEPKHYNVDPSLFSAGTTVQSGKKRWAKLV